MEIIKALQHRDAHFAGNYNLMLEYYQNNSGAGILLDMEDVMAIKDIKFGLSQEDREPVNKCLMLYSKLASCYQQKEEIPKMICDLILSEEEFPDTEPLAQFPQIYPTIIKVMTNTSLSSSLSPGYGRSAMLMAMVLEKMKIPETLPHLFGLLHFVEFDTEEAISKAIISIPTSKDFLINKMSAMPVNKENKMAAFLLTRYQADKKIELAASQLLEKELPDKIITKYLTELVQPTLL